MRAKVALLALLGSVAPALAEDAVEACLACHLDGDTGAIDIVGIEALDALPPIWPMLFEDAFDLNGDGVAGIASFIDGETRPVIAIWGEKLAAARFSDFARIAGATHGIDVSEPATLARIEAAFRERSPAPASPFADAAAEARFVADGCARCHVTDTYDAPGGAMMPLSDFLLHDLGDGPRRTAPLWVCATCARAVPDAPHPLPGAG